METIGMPSSEELARHHCLENVDRVPGDPETTAFKRRARLLQALWRETRGLPIGTEPMRPKPGQTGRWVGNRMEADHAFASKANFLNDRVRDAVRYRLEHPEPNQTLDPVRLHCNLLSSMPMCFNLFGPFHSDLDMADRAVHRWWPDAPGKVRAVRFEWSPGRRLTSQYLEDKSAFDLAFELDLGGGRLGALGVECKYHEDSKGEEPPKDAPVRRYTEVASASRVFKPGALNSVWGTDLQQILRDHLLALSMLQHPSRTWAWAKFVLVHPRRNPSYARATTRYRALLADASTFEVNTLEDLLAAGVLPPDTAAAFRERYLW